MKLSTLKTSTRLAGVLGLLSALLLVIVTVALLQMQTMRNSTMDISNSGQAPYRLSLSA